MQLNILQVGVSKSGLSLKQPLVPWVYNICAFIPWPDTVLRESGDDIFLGSAGVPDVEFRLNKIVLKAMQQKLMSRVPFGHVA